MWIQLQGRKGRHVKNSWGDFCLSLPEREREGMLRIAGVISAFHCPRELLEFVDLLRG